MMTVRDFMKMSHFSPNAAAKHPSGNLNKTVDII